MITFSLSLSLCHPQKFHLVQSLNVSCSCLNSDSTGACQTLRSALNTTCRLYEANSVLSSISLPNQTAKQVLNVMSERSIEDACIWLNETLRSAGIGSSGLPSSVQCSSVSTLSGVCSQWSEFVSIMKIGSKVDRLGASPISEKNWFKRHLIYGSPERC